MTELRIMAPLANDRATPASWTARLKLTAGALGIVDVYDPSGAWAVRMRWSAVAGFEPSYPSDPAGSVERGDAVLAALSTSLFTALQVVVSRRPRAKSRRAA